MSILSNFDISSISPEQPVLIAGPTASGKSRLALEIAQRQGGVIINADASQIYDCWNVITACPSEEEMTRAPHHLYRHVPYDCTYSAGHWLREVKPYFAQTLRPIIVGGTGLYFGALTKGLAEIPPTPPSIRQLGDEMSLETMIAQLDLQTRDRIDLRNRARVQRAWEVLRATNKGLALWQDDTPPPVLPQDSSFNIVLESSKEWLNERIALRFDLMLASGALDEIAQMQAQYDPSLPSCRAIGVPELMAHHLGQMSLQEAKELAVIATCQYAKRQRTWFRSKMKSWTKVQIGE